MTPPFNHDGPRLTDSEFRMFAELVRSHAGLEFGDESRFVLERRLDRRIRALELGSVAAYHYYLRDSSLGGGELANLVDELTTNEGTLDPSASGRQAARAAKSPTASR
jgi:chemotaxis protein methyltransferase CheR